MATSDINVEICNLALSHVGGFPIQSVTEATKEARECKRLYPTAKDSTLEAFDWDFARKEKALGELSGNGVTRSGWTYSYEWPSDCVIPRRIYNAADKHKKIEYEIGVNDDLNKRMILCNEEDAILIYTARVSDANLFSPSFKEALGYRLGSELAFPLRAKSDLKTSLFREFLLKVGSSQESNANASEKYLTTETSSFQDAR